MHPHHCRPFITYQMDFHLNVFFLLLSTMRSIRNIRTIQHIKSYELAPTKGGGFHSNTDRYAQRIFIATPETSNYRETNTTDNVSKKLYRQFQSILSHRHTQ